MKLQEFILKEGQKVISQLGEQQSMDALKEYLHQKGVIISAEEEERLNLLLIQKKNGAALSDDQLNSINGGGFYRPITDCPNGHTKHVAWLGTRQDLVDDNCKNCENAKIEVLRPNKPHQKSWVCKNMGYTVWEW